MLLTTTIPIHLPVTHPPPDHINIDDDDDNVVFWGPPKPFEEANTHLKGRKTLKWELEDFLAAGGAGQEVVVGDSVGLQDEVQESQEPEDIPIPHVEDAPPSPPPTSPSPPSSATKTLTPKPTISRHRIHKTHRQHLLHHRLLSLLPHHHDTLKPSHRSSHTSSRRFRRMLNRLFHSLHHKSLIPFLPPLPPPRQPTRLRILKIRQRKRLSQNLETAVVKVQHWWRNRRYGSGDDLISDGVETDGSVDIGISSTEDTSSTSENRRTRRRSLLNDKPNAAADADTSSEGKRTRRCSLSSQLPIEPLQPLYEGRQTRRRSLLLQTTISDRSSVHSDGVECEKGVNESERAGKDVDAVDVTGSLERPSDAVQSTSDDKGTDGETHENGKAVHVGSEEVKEGDEMNDSPVSDVSDTKSITLTARQRRVAEKAAKLAAIRLEKQRLLDLQTAKQTPPPPNPSPPSPSPTTTTSSPSPLKASQILSLTPNRLEVLTERNRERNAGYKCRIVLKPAEGERPVSPTAKLMARMEERKSNPLLRFSIPEEEGNTEDGGVGRSKLKWKKDLLSVVEYDDKGSAVLVGLHGAGRMLPKERLSLKEERLKRPIEGLGRVPGTPGVRRLRGVYESVTSPELRGIEVFVGSWRVREEMEERERCDREAVEEGKK
ncbi:hypothetical protein HK097_005187, partial [Rhizophlyctis rosea]